jgi:Protein of unknown function (DUF4199)
MLKKYPLVAVSVRNGLIGGVLGTVLLLTLYFLGRHPFLIPVFFDFRILLFSVLIFFTLKEFRDYFQDGILFFWQGMIMSLIFTWVFAAVAFLILWAFAAWRPEFVSSYISLTREQILSIPPETIERIGKEAYERNLKALPDTKASDLALLYFAQSFGISFFISIIISVILRRQPKL